MILRPMAIGIRHQHHLRGNSTTAGARWLGVRDARARRLRRVHGWRRRLRGQVTWEGP
jgi:hypothetical protein